MDYNNLELIIKNVLKELETGKNEKIQNIPEYAKVAMLLEKEKFKIESFKIPNINDDEILVKIEGVGICGTDAHEFKSDPFKLAPVVLGHEGTGEIVKIGKNINKDTAGKKIGVGDKIVTSVIPCGECYFCKNHPEKTNLCENMGVYGLITDDEYHFNGWFGEYIVIRKGSTFFNVSELDLDSRILIEPAAVVVHAVERAKTTGILKFNSKVLVQGCGPIGLLLLSVLRTMGIENLYAVDGNEKRLEIARKFGAKTFNFSEYSSFEKMLESVKEETGVGVDFAFQCTGVPAAASNLPKFVRRGGGICEVGFFVDNGDAKFNPHYDFCQKEITLVGSWVYTPQDYLITLDFIKRAKGLGLPLNELITHRFSLEEIEEAMRTNISLEGIKIALIMN